MRSPQIPLYAPPEVTLGAVRDGSELMVSIAGICEAASAHWESRGRVSGQGLEVRWSPADEDDQLRVAIRTRSGVAIAAIRAKDLAS